MNCGCLFNIFIDILIKRYKISKKLINNKRLRIK